MVSLAGESAYIHSNTVIYAIEGYSQYANLRAGLLIPLDAGAFTAVISEIALVETVVGPRKTGVPVNESQDVE